MKDFNEFRRFLLEDCRHEINAIGDALVNNFTDDDFKRTGLNPEALGQLAKIFSFQTAQFVMLALERYHEWNETFSEQTPEFPD